MLVTLGKAGIKTIDNLGDLATDELIDPGNSEGVGRGILADYMLDEEEASTLIMSARAHWFEEDESIAEGGEAALEPDGETPQHDEES